MATPPSNEASEIRRRGRRRLIGAVAIVVLAVVFVPMILDSEPRKARQGPTLEIPAKENAPPLPTPPAEPRASPPAEPKAAAPVEAKAAAAEPKATPAADPKAAPAEPKAAPPTKPAPAPSPAPTAAPRLEGFAVQVGAFKDEDKLKQAREKLAAARITHYIERRGAQGGDLTRLRAGPYPTREAADKALAAVKAAGLEGQVVPLP
jgi:DedD protein